MSVNLILGYVQNWKCVRVSYYVCKFSKLPWWILSKCQKPVKAEPAKPAEKKPATAKSATAKSTATNTTATKSSTAKPAAKPSAKSEPAKPATKTYHISKRKDNNMWQIKAAGGAKAIKLFKTQKEAIDYCKSLADNQDANIMIHKEDGSFRKLTYKK